MTAIPIIEDQQIFEQLKTQHNPFFANYLAFYSSWYGGITLNPYLMLLPIDDHIVHRGDGIFEAIRAEGRSVYLLNEHLQRLFRSAERISLQIPYSLDEAKAIILTTLQAANQETAMIRVYVSRGPGDFTVNPYDSIQAQLYVIITRFKLPKPEIYQNGVVVGQSTIPVKSPMMAQVKSCNYLPNVLMKKEAVDRGIDFVIGVDHNGCITESATENIMIVDQQGVLVHPKLDAILTGTIMIRACELAREHGIKTEARDISLRELSKAQEIMLTGTTLNVLPVVAFEGVKINGGNPGPMTQKLQQLVLKDIRSTVRGTPF
jgi:4-amino-4-deoxychorismate lyase